jgi:hypothetical protein
MSDFWILTVDVKIKQFTVYKNASHVKRDKTVTSFEKAAKFEHSRVSVIKVNHSAKLRE